MINNLTHKAINLKTELTSILADIETSSYRLASIESTLKKLNTLSIKQQDLLMQSLECIRYGLRRAAIVLAWAAFIDFIHDIVASDNFKTVIIYHAAWNIKIKEDLREVSDYHLIEFLKKCGFIKRTFYKALHGLLNTRNEAAHPEDIEPDHNKALSFISDCIARINLLRNKNYPT